MGIGGGINTYAFGGGDAVNMRDPSGTCSLNRVYFLLPSGAKQYTGQDWLSGDDCDDILNGQQKGGGQSEPTKPDVVKHFGKIMACSASAASVMQAVEHNFGNFGNYFRLGGLLGVTFSPPENLSSGSSIPILVRTGFAQNMSVNVATVTSRSMSFTTTPGHLLYPAQITFSAANTSASSIVFNIDIVGSNPGGLRSFEFWVGGGRFEDSQWRNFLSKVSDFCHGGS